MMGWVCRKHGKNCNSYVKRIIIEELNRKGITRNKLKQYISKNYFHRDHYPKLIKWVKS